MRESVYAAADTATCGNVLREYFFVESEKYLGDLHGLEGQDNYASEFYFLHRSTSDALAGEGPGSLTDSREDDCHPY